MDTTHRTYITEVDLHTACGRSVRYTGQCRAEHPPDPDYVLPSAERAALAYHPRARVVESRMRAA